MKKTSNRTIVKHVTLQMEESGFDVSDLDVYDCIQHAVALTIQQLEFEAQDRGEHLVRNV